MKNIQIIDGARNSEYAIYAVTDEEFDVLFPGSNQNVAFIEDIVTILGDDGVGEFFTPIWGRRTEKPDVKGIHGTLFYGLYWKKEYYPTLNDREMKL